MEFVIPIDIQNRMSLDEDTELERLTYLIISKVGPHVLVRYNQLRDFSSLHYDRNEITSAGEKKRSLRRNTIERKRKQDESSIDSN